MITASDVHGSLPLYLVESAKRLQHVRFCCALSTQHVVQLLLDDIEIRIQWIDEGYELRIADSINTCITMHKWTFAVPVMK